MRSGAEHLGVGEGGAARLVSSLVGVDQHSGQERERERERERESLRGGLGTSRVSPSRRRQESQLGTLESGRALKY